MCASWSNDKIISFVDAIHLRTCLWDVNNLEYKNRNLKKDEWDAIGIQFEIPAEEAQKKFKNLRTYFMNEIRKLEKKQKSGSGAFQNSSWFAFKSMSFLRTTVEADPGKDSESLSEKNGDSDDDTFSSKLQETPPLTRKASLQKKRIEADKQFENACEVMEEVKKKMSKKTLAFGDHVNEKLLTYNEFVRNQVEYKISTILFEADMGYFNRPLSHSRNSQVSSRPHSSYSPATFTSFSLPSPVSIPNSQWAHIHNSHTESNTQMSITPTDNANPFPSQQVQPYSVNADTSQNQAEEYDNNVMLIRTIGTIGRRSETSSPRVQYITTDNYTETCID